MATACWQCACDLRRRGAVRADHASGRLGNGSEPGAGTSWRQKGQIDPGRKVKYVRHILISLLLALVAASPIWAQDSSTVELQVERLRVQLRDLVDREAQLQDRVARLDEDLRPENIEHSVAGMGTTDASALRAKRREQLEKEKADIAGQLSEVSAKRNRLEAEIAAAEAESVRLKAAALAPKEIAPRDTPVAAPVKAAPAPAVKRKAPAKRKRIPRKRNRPLRRA